MTQKIEHTGRIPVVDEHGTTLYLDEYTTFTEFKAVDGSQSWHPGSHTYELDGEHCNDEPPDKFITFDTGKVLRRV